MMLHRHIFAMPEPIGHVVLPTQEACEAVRKAVLSIGMLDVGTITAESCLEVQRS